jgi:hypothetical protein
MNHPDCRHLRLVVFNTARRAINGSGNGALLNRLIIQSLTAGCDKCFPAVA